MRPCFAVVIALGLVMACAGESGEDGVKAPPASSEQGKGEDEAGSAASGPEQTEVSANELTITAAEAEAAGLPRLGFSLALAGSAMSGSRLDYGRYATLSGPPGGPLSLLISAASVGAAFADHVGGDQVLDARLLEQEVELLGAKRRAAAWITGESLARTSWCAILVAPEGAGAGEPALLLELGVGHQGDDVSCATAREHHVLKPVVESLKLLTQ